MGPSSSPTRINIASWPSSWALERETRWGNKDTDPVPSHLRTWSSLAYVAYWVSDATNVGTWQIGSSMLAVGLSWYTLNLFCLDRIFMECIRRREALSAVVLGNLIIAIAMVLNGTIGARLHISFPILNRSSFGYWFSYFSVISRVVLSMFWFGIQVFSHLTCPVIFY
jgi:NCS1 family nucleobase:cation symporter-1